MNLARPSYFGSALGFAVISACSDGEPAAPSSSDAGTADAAVDGRVVNDLGSSPIDPCTGGGVRVVLEPRPEFNNWYFGMGAGFAFGTSPPSELIDGQLLTNEGVATYSDEAGQLLMYSDGSYIWDREHNTMPLASEPDHRLGGSGSATQSAVFVPRPGHPSQFYLFTQNATEQNELPRAERGAEYSLIDLSLRGGLGDVVPEVRRVRLHAPSTEKLVAVRHANGVDFWIVTHDWGTNCFRSHRVTESGVASDADAVVSCSGIIVPDFDENASIGYMKADRLGQRLAVSYGGYTPNNYPGATSANRLALELADFDSSTGQVTSVRILSQGPYYYGVEFSPAGTRLFATAWDDAGTETALEQFDLCAADIAASRTVIDVVDGDSTYSFLAGLQLGPDGKIYVARNARVLGRIDEPDALGAEVGFDADAVVLTRRSGLGLPNFIQFYARPEDDILL